MKRRELAGFYLLLALVAVPAFLVVLVNYWLMSLGASPWVAAGVVLLTAPPIALCAVGVHRRIETWWRNR